MMPQSKTQKVSKNLLSFQDDDNDDDDTETLQEKFQQLSVKRKKNPLKKNMRLRTPREDNNDDDDDTTKDLPANKIIREVNGDVDHKQTISTSLATASLLYSPATEQFFSNTGLSLASSKKKGNYVVAAKKIQRGTLLFRDEPFSFVATSTIVCHRCMKKTQNSIMKRCSVCKTAKYCSAQCQKAAWSLHKIECQFNKTKNETQKEKAGNDDRKQEPQQTKPVDLVNNKQTSTIHSCINLLVKILSILKQNRMALEDSPLSFLVSHRQDIAKTNKELDFCALIMKAKQFLTFSKEKSLAESTLLEEKLFSTKSLLELLAIISCNSFSITDEELQIIGVGLYLHAAMLNHSCKPNATMVFNGTTLYVRALETLSPGDEILISYIDLLETTRKRQQELNERYYFSCDCKKCLNVDYILEEKAKNYLLCQFCDQANIESTDNHVCPDNNHSSSCMPLNYSLNVIENLKNSLAPTKEHRFKRAEKIKGVLEQICVSPFYNVDYINSLNEAMDAAIEINEYSQALEYGKASLIGMKFYYTQFHPAVGLHLFKLGKIEIHCLNNFEAGLESLREAQLIIAFLFPPSHPLLKLINDEIRQVLFADHSENP